MNEFDARIFDLLDAFTPEPKRRPNWRDVVARAHRSRTRRVIFLVAAALVVFATAAGVTAALGGFDAWLSGQPGKPAGQSEQERFESANGRTLAAFPKTTKLRELLRTKVDGKEYVLFGWRSGDTLCLKLRAVTLGHSTGPSCTPRATLARSAAPIAVVNRAWGFEDRHARATALVSFGIAADGVRSVDIETTDGVHEAALGGNSYLFVESEPITGTRVLGLSAVSSAGRRTAIRFGTTYGLFGGSEVARPPRGPRKVQARVEHPAIGWFVRGERRGVSLAALKPAEYRGLGISQRARFVKPDPLNDIVVGLDRSICLVLVLEDGSGEGCNTPSGFFERGPLNVMTAGGGGTESLVAAGAAADGIVKVVAFASDGERFTIPLRDNLFGARFALSQFPIRLVGYDVRGRVAGIETLSSTFPGTVVPAGAWVPTGRNIRARGPNGATAELQITRGTKKLGCWIVRFSSGQARRGCKPLYPTGPWVEADLVQAAGRDLFVVGNVRAPVKRVRLEFADGGVIAKRPVADLFLFAIPRRYVRAERQLAFVRGYDRRGRVVQRSPVLFKLRSG